MPLPPEIRRWFAPGDEKHVGKDWPDLNLHFVESATDPAFDLCYALLDREFGSRNELETEEVLHTRLASARMSASGSHRLHYRLGLISGPDGRPAAVRDHTVIVPTDPADRGAVVHLSHALVEPAWRRTGLAAWLRSIPAWDASEHLAGENRSIDLVAEMEPPDETCDATLIRLAAYGKAGFLKPDLGPGGTYLQPDFRSTTAIDESGGPEPLALMLVVRRIDRELEKSMSGEELQRLVGALYAMYGAEFREADMIPCYGTMQYMPAGETVVPLAFPA